MDSRDPGAAAATAARPSLSSDTPEASSDVQRRFRACRRWTIVGGVIPGWLQDNGVVAHRMVETCKRAAGHISRRESGTGARGRRGHCGKAAAMEDDGGGAGSKTKAWFGRVRDAARCQFSNVPGWLGCRVGSGSSEEALAAVIVRGGSHGRAAAGRRHYTAAAESESIRMGEHRRSSGVTESQTTRRRTERTRQRTRGSGCWGGVVSAASDRAPIHAEVALRSSPPGTDRRPSPVPVVWVLEGVVAAEPELLVDG
jgi:hypothetical protein